MDPLLTQGDGVELLYDNDYDEFSPISQELEKKFTQDRWYRLGEF